MVKAQMCKVRWLCNKTENLGYVEHFILQEYYRKLTGSISNCLIRVYGFVQISAIEEILQEFLNFRNSSRASDQDNVMDRRFVHLGITKRFLDGLQGATKQVSIQLLKPGTSYAGVEINAFKQRVYLDRCLETTTEIQWTR